MKTTAEQLRLKTIFIFWMPLAATWLMMAVEGPFISALIARLAEPKFNLAAYGVAFSFALIIEAPVIMMMSASTRLVVNRYAYLRLRNFTLWLNAAITAAMVLLLLPTIFNLLFLKVIGLPGPVAELTHRALLILLPWPGAIGIRRFYQGILIRNNRTRLVAAGTVIRLFSMAITAGSLYLYFDFPGAVVGASALSVGVSMEALASHWMVRGMVKHILRLPDPGSEEAGSIQYREIARFYFPLALTPVLALGAQPIVTFFVSRSHMAVESLAVLPVVYSLVFIFRSLGLSFAEVTIALLGDDYQGYRPLRNFAAVLGMAVVAVLSLIAFSPLADLWFHTVSGLSLQLTAFAELPTRIFAIMPGLSVMTSLQRGVLVHARRTLPITWATALELAGIVLALVMFIYGWEMVGVVAAAAALVLGRLAANLYLMPAYHRSLPLASR